MILETLNSYTQYTFTSGFIGGVMVVESVHAVEPIEDWSGCRSISRAKRRARLGHPQRMVVRQKPACFKMGDDKIVIHPVLYREAAKQLSEKIERDMNLAITGLLYPSARQAKDGQ